MSMQKPNRVSIILTVLSIAGTVTAANAQTEPVGGQPAPGAKQSVSDLDAQVAYQRAFEGVLWAMPASAIYRFRVGMLEVPGMADNVISAFSGPLKMEHELITVSQAVHAISRPRARAR